jgi:hypothetical protein
MVMMSPITDTIMMRAIRELNALQQSYIYQLFNRAEHRSATDALIILAQRLPQVIRREINPTSGELNQALSDEAALACVALAQFMKCEMNLLCNIL